MFKKILTFVFIAAIGLLMSGCVKYTTTMEINKKDQLTITQKVTFDKRAIDQDDENIDFEYILEKFTDILENDKDKSYGTKGYTIKKLKDNDTEGRVYTKKSKKAGYLSIEDLPDGFNIPSEANEPISIKTSPFGTKYKINLVYSPKKVKQANYPLFDKEGMERYGLSEEGIKPLLEKSSCDLTIKLPRKATKHNANKVNEKTHEYYWDFGNLNDVDNKMSIPISVEYGKTNFLSIIFLIIILIVTIVVVNKNKDFQKKDSDETKSAF